jgi:hypothetical protein
MLTGPPPKFNGTRDILTNASGDTHKSSVTAGESKAPILMLGCKLTRLDSARRAYEFVSKTLR